MAKAINPLQKQLDDQRFLHALQYAESESHGLKKLSTTELSRTNQYLTGHAHDEDFDPWRFEAVEIQIPTGQVHKMNVLTNPIARARELISTSLQMSGNGQGIEAAHYLYSHLVLEHLFKQANRRTAVMAALWILLISGHQIDGQKLLAISIGDLRDPKELQALQLKMKALVTN